MLVIVAGYAPISLYELFICESQYMAIRPSAAWSSYMSNHNYIVIRLGLTKHDEGVTLLYFTIDVQTKSISDISEGNSYLSTH